MVLSSGFSSLSPGSDGCLKPKRVNFQKHSLAIWCLHRFKLGDADTWQIVKWSLQEDVAIVGLRAMGRLHADRSLASGGASVPVSGPADQHCVQGLSLLALIRRAARSYPTSKI